MDSDTLITLARLVKLLGKGVHLEVYAVGDWWHATLSYDGRQETSVARDLEGVLFNVVVDWIGVMPQQEWRET